MIGKLLLVFLLFSNTLTFANNSKAKAPSCPSTCPLTSEEVDHLIIQVEELVAANDKLLAIAREYEELLKSTPSITLDPYTIFLDKEGRVFSNNEIAGKMKFGSLDYDLKLKMNTIVSKQKESDYGFDLKFKAAYLYSLETTSDEVIKGYHTGGLATEFFHYKKANLNVALSPRHLSTLVGFDLTNHFDILLGLGMTWSRTSTVVSGLSFDF